MLLGFWLKRVLPGLGLLSLVGFLVVEHYPQPPVRQPKAARIIPPKPTVDAAYLDCEKRKVAVLSETAAPGVPELEAVRAELFARAKAEPVLFLERPRDPTLAPELMAWRERLVNDPAPWRILDPMLKKLRGQPSKLRQALLVDGYLYAETPHLAALLAGGITLRLLFSEPKLVVTRGHQILHVERKDGEYRWVDGPEVGELARLWMFDRVAADGETLGPTVHLGIGGLLEDVGADSVSFEQVTYDHAIAKLRYGELETTAVFEIRDTELVLGCELVPAAEREKLEAARALVRRQQRVLAALNQAIAEQVDLSIPFDEPRTEEGQQDGKLRQEWRQAYKNGQWAFMFNDDKYFVFDSKGRPRPPQVCADFITETWERMSGTRWLERQKGRRRQIGALDFDALDIENRRSVEQLIVFAETHPEWFEVLRVPESERVPLQGRRRFFQRLFEQRHNFQPGDMVAILGPRDDGLLHYHSFFIVAKDPITEMPTWVASNAGRPRIRSFEAEMQNAPQRSIMARIRPRLSWLESLLAPRTATEPKTSD